VYLSESLSGVNSQLLPHYNCPSKNTFSTLPVFRSGVTKPLILISKIGNYCKANQRFAHTPTESETQPNLGHASFVTRSPRDTRISVASVWGPRVRLRNSKPKRNGNIVQNNIYPLSIPNRSSRASREVLAGK